MQQAEAHRIHSRPQRGGVERDRRDHRRDHCRDRCRACPTGDRGETEGQRQPRAAERVADAPGSRRLLACGDP
jgi:hypothetical protein